MNEPHAVYRLYGKSKNLLYVGCSKNLRYRLQQHRYASYGKRLAYYSEESYPNRDEALYAEAEAIRREMPPLNTQHKTLYVGHYMAIFNVDYDALEDLPLHRIMAHYTSLCRNEPQARRKAAVDALEDILNGVPVRAGTIDRGCFERGVYLPRYMDMDACELVEARAEIDKLYRISQTNIRREKAKTPPPSKQ